MNFKLGEKYIVDVTENGLIPLMEFNRDRWYDKDNDDLDFLTEEEKKVVITEVLDKIGAKIKQLTSRYVISRERGSTGQVEWQDRLIREDDILLIIDQYKTESEE